jgi:hypothetical protein
MLRDLPFSALQFAFYEQLKRWSINLRQHLTGRARNLSDYAPWEVIHGVIAGGLAGFITTPLGSLVPVSLLILDVVKTRIQTGTRSSPTKSAKVIGAQIPLAAGFTTQPRNIGTESVVAVLRHVHNHEGWKGLFRGMGPRSGWCGSQSGIMFLGYEFFLRLLENWDTGGEDTGS